MKQPDANFLPGSAFSLDQDRDVGFGYLFQLVAGSLHGRSFAKDNIQRGKVERDGFSIGDQGRVFL